MSRLILSGTALFLGLLLAPAGARAQCVVEGRGIVRDVTPIGTSLRFGLDEEARVELNGAQALVHGVTPIAFEGRARTSDVELSLAAPRRLLGIVQADAGVSLRATRGRASRVSARIDAGPTRLWVELPCDALRFGAAASDATGALPAAPLHDGALVRVRGDELRAFRSARDGDGVVLRLRPGDERGWPHLEVLGANGGRVHVRAVLDAGVVLDAWVLRESVGPLPEVLSGCGCDCMGSMGGCGHGFAGETYRGAATLASGAALRDAFGTVWGRLVSEVEVEVAVSALVAVSRTSEGETRHVTETVWIERLPGVIPDSCAAIQITVDRAAVTLPSAP